MLGVLHYALVALLADEALLIVEPLHEIGIVSRLFALDARDTRVVAIARRVNLPYERILLLKTSVLVRDGKASN